MQNSDSHIQSQKLLKAFDLIKQKNFDAAEATLNEGLKEAESQNDKVLQALFYSGLGVLSKVQKEFRKSWKYYEKAEKLMPEDPSLKIISARLLVDYFGQYDLVIKKMNKVLDKTKGFAPFQYQAYTVLGLAYLRKGDKKQAAEQLKHSMGFLNKALDTVANIDFELVQALIKKNIEPKLCLDFLETAKTLATVFHEDIMAKFIQKLIDQFPNQIPS